MKHLIAPSLLSADFMNLQRDIEMVNESEADWFHLDIMDGVFVPNITYGFPVIKQIRKIAKKPLDTHLMIVNPEQYITAFKNSGVDILNVHFEASTHLHRTVQKIKSLDMKAGISLNPHTPVHFIEDIVCDVDVVMLMSVNPGFAGQKFIANTYKKISQLKNMIEQKNTDTLIEVDGGVDLSNAAKLVEMGADVLVSGSFIFKSEKPKQTIQQLKTMKS